MNHDVPTMAIPLGWRTPPTTAARSTRSLITTIAKTLVASIVFLAVVAGINIASAYADTIAVEGSRCSLADSITAGTATARVALPIIATDFVGARGGAIIGNDGNCW